MTHITLRQRTVRAGLAVAAAVVLVSGAAWVGSAANSPSSVGHAATATPIATQVATPNSAATSIGHAVAGGRDSYSDVVSPAVVTVRADGRAQVSPTQFQIPEDDFFGQFFGNRGPSQRGPRGQLPRQRQTALGSGVIVTTDGYILTNNHVVEGADSISVDFTDGRTLSAKTIGTDKPSDLALLKITGASFHAIALGNSDSVKVGDVVLAVGNPMNLGQTVTMGIISAKGRSTSVGDGSYEDFLQTDAPINHGNSGGALVNTKGELVGINSQILSNSDGNIGIGFAIPVNMARHVMDDLRTKGKVTRAQLGISVQNVSSDMAASLGLKQPGGVIVGSVTAGGAADRAGLKRGDVIESFNGQPVHDTNSLRNRVAEAGPGSPADLVIARDGAEKHLSAKLDEADGQRSARRADDGQRGSADKTSLGVSVEPLTPELAARAGVPRSTQGLVIAEVDPDGRAAEAGLRAGDVIQEVNRQPVKSVDDLRAAVKRTTDKPALLLINRQGSDIFVTVKPANG